MLLRGYIQSATCIGACRYSSADTSRVHTLFANSTFWKEHDIFARQKSSTFASSRVAVQELASRFVQLNDDALEAEQARLLFEEMVHIALWGNATDLSLLSNLSLKEIQQLQGAAAIKRNERNIVANDTDKVWSYISEGLHQVDIVLDNSGFEYFTDLIFALYLLKQHLAQKIVLHVKDIPWFVSDVTPRDVVQTLKELELSDIFQNRAAIDGFLRILREYLDKGIISVRQSPFWTSYKTFHDLPSSDSVLHAHLCRSDLVIFKGDLNYRKLTLDGLWPHDTQFSTALGPLGNGSGLKILALRTNKADVCVGLKDQRQIDRLDAEAPNNAWVRNGKYAVISFSTGK